MDAESVRIAEAGTLTMPDDVWDRTKLISVAIAPLAGYLSPRDSYRSTGPNSSSGQNPCYVAPTGLA